MIYCYLVKGTQKKNMKKLSANSQEFKIKKLGIARTFLGWEIEKIQDGMFIHQSTYTNDILRKFGFLNCNPAPTPTTKENGKGNYNTEEEVIKDFPYRQIIGSLNYLVMGTRPDIAYAVNIVARHLDNPQNEHIKMVKSILRYLKGTAEYGLKFTRSDNQILHGYSDSDFANSKDDRKSTSGYCFL